MNDDLPLEAIFFAALEKASPKERAAYLDQVSAGDSNLRRRIEKMLAAQIQAGSFLEHPAPGLVATVDEPISEHPGTIIGPYKLMEQIGEGGMGLVFVAEQQQPVRRKVALKVIKPGMDTRQVVARFEAERQVLALMDHPNIAKVFDGGTTDSGRPYFVMELVKGVPITEYCDQNQLPIRQRLELFVSVCQAVQHAHQKGIIHRDLKPSNVLVVSHDGTPVVKVIDFGVAKAIGQRLTDKTVYTQFTQMIGTPLYMSPEQAGESGLDVDTRSDIYSLGVFLYELLTGTTPFDKERLGAVDYDEMRRIIREEEPPKPSTRINTLGQAATTVSTQRQSDPKRLSQLCRGEVDWIVMKALEKDRNHRYESASAFAADVERYLHDEPVLACPPSLAYRLGKFARRYRAILGTTALVLLVLVAGVVVSTWQAIQARQARDEMEKNQKEAEANFRKARQAVRDQFTLVSESKLFETPGFQSLRKELLESALKYYQEFLEERPDDPEVQVEVAAASLRLYQIDQNMHGFLNADAMRALEKTLAIVEALLEDHPADSSLFRELAGFTRESRLFHHPVRNPQPRYPEPTWLPLAERAVVLWEKFVRANPMEPGFQFDLAGFYYLTYNRQLEAGHPANALANLCRAYDLQEKLAREYPKVTQYRAALAQSHYELADRLLQGGPPEEIEEHCRRALALRKQLTREWPEVTEYQVVLADSYMVLGDRLSENGKGSEAESHYREALALNNRLVADFPRVPYYRVQLAFNYDCLGHLFRDANRSQEAIPNYRQALANWDKLAAASPDLVGYQVSRSYSCFNLGPLLVASGQQQEADQVYRKAFEVTAPGPDGRNLRAACLILCPEARFRDPGQAIVLVKEALKEEPTDGNTLNTLGIAYYQDGNWTEAVAALEKSMRIVHDLSGGDADYLPLNYFSLAMAHYQLGKKELARKYYDEGAEWMKAHSSLTGSTRQMRDGWRQDCRTVQNQAAELLGIKAQHNGTQSGSRKQ